MGFGGFGRNREDFKIPEGMEPDKMKDMPMPDFMGGMPGDMQMPDFNGENGNLPEGFDGKMPEGFDGKMPEGFDWKMPEGDQNGRMKRDGKGFGFNSKNESKFIRVHVDGHIVSFETEPVLENDTTLVGFRAILEALGAEVIWDEATQTVTAVKDDTTIVLTIGSDTAYVNGEPTALLAAPAIIGESAMIPIRFVSENMGMKVSWDGDTKLITVNSK